MIFFLLIKSYIMQKVAESSCIRCGKVRVFKRKWKEIPEKGAAIIHIETTCPDLECQKIVDAQFAEKREKRLLSEARRTGIKL